MLCMINPFDLMKKAGDIKNIFENLHLEQISESGEAGGGLVKVVLNGRLEIISLEIDPIAVDKRDIKMLQDLIMSAHNAASKKIIESIKAKLSTELGGLNLSGLNL